MTISTERLLPCPFCGCRPNDYPQNTSFPRKKGNGFTVRIWCENCDALGPERDTDEEATAAWNRRSAGAEGREAQERIKALMLERSNLIATKAEQLVALTKERDEALRVATDRRYFMEAYWSMLGPIGLKVAAMWQERGVRRVHHSWGPEAHKLTGEERAQVILDMEDAAKTARRVDSIDGPVNSETSHGA